MEVFVRSNIGYQIGRLMSAARSIGLFAIFSFSSLASADDAVNWNKRIKVTGDEFSSVIGLTGPDHTDGQLYGRAALKWSLVAMLNKKDAQLSIVILFENFYVAENWRFWNSASTNQAETLKVASRARHVDACRRGSCMYVEGVAVILNEEILSRAASDGDVKIRIRGQNADPITIDIDQIEASSLLAAIEEYRSQLKTLPVTEGITK